MSFLKKRGKSLFISFASIFFILQGIAIFYGRSHRNHQEPINQLSVIWTKANVGHLITLETFANNAELKSAKERLEEAKEEIQKIKTLVDKESFQKAHDYYETSILALLEIVDFLLTREYAVQKDEINFANDEEGKEFIRLLNQLNALHQKT